MRSVLEFLQAYEQLAEQGACDTPGGAEYHRVRAEWLALDRPDDVVEFIRLRANRPPAGGDSGGVTVEDLDAEVRRLAAEDPEFARFCRFGVPAMRPRSER